MKRIERIMNFDQSRVISEKLPVFPAQAGIQTNDVNPVSLDPRLRGGDVLRGGDGKKRLWTASVFTTALLLCVALAFCQEGKQVTTNEAGEFTTDTGVKGTVTMDGKPLAGAVVTIVPRESADGGFVTSGVPGVSGFTHMVVFQPTGDFNPRNPMQFLALFRERLIARGPVTGYFRTKPVDGKLVGSLLTGDPVGLEQFIRSYSELEFVRSERLTKESFEAYEKTPQLSLSPADGGFAAQGIFTHIVYFGGKGDFEPKSKTSLCRRVGKVLMDAGIRCGVQRSRVENGKLIGAILTDDPKGCQAAIDAHPELQFLRDERLTEQSYQVYLVYRGEDFLPPADGGFRWLGHQYIVTFKAKEGFTPKTERELFDTIYRSSTFCARFKMRKDGDQIFGTFITDDPDELKLVIAEDSRLEYVGAERLTKESFEAYNRRL